MKIKVFCDVTPCRLVNIYQSVDESYRVNLEGEAVLKTRLSFETSVTTYQSTRRKAPEDCTVKQHGRQYVTLSMTLYHIRQCT